MTRRIKRIAATITAGILLVCVSFASFAEEASETLGEYATEAVEITEGAIDTETAESAEETEDAAEGTAEETAAVTEETGETTEETANEPIEETVTETTEETAETVTEENTAAEEYYEFTEADDSEYKDLSEDAGYIDQAVVQQYIPEVTEELIAASEQYTGTAEETEENQENEIAEEPEATEEEKQETAAARMWITAEADETFIGDTLKLKANSTDELNGDITWEIRNELWEKDVWQKAGEGKELELDISEENDGYLVRFMTAESAVSENYKIKAAEKAEEEPTETAETADEPEMEASESTENEENRPESENETPVTEENSAENDENENTKTLNTKTLNENEETAEEPAATIVTRAWITAEGNTLTANAEPELTGVSTWQTWNAENEKWQKIGYGDQVTVEELNGLYRFVMQDGTVSEEFGTVPAEETVEETAENATEETAKEIAEELPEVPETPKAPEIPETHELPEVPEPPVERNINVTVTWDTENPAVGDTAHFHAELTGYDGLAYTAQWQYSTDQESWYDLPGENNTDMDITVTTENNYFFWRILVNVEGEADN